MASMEDCTSSARVASRATSRRRLRRCFAFSGRCVVAAAPSVTSRTSLVVSIGCCALHESPCPLVTCWTGAHGVYGNKHRVLVCPLQATRAGQTHIWPLPPVSTQPLH
jgi:hypothetical protein